MNPLHKLRQFFPPLPPHEMIITWSTILTIARILLTPCVVVAMVMHQWGWAFVLFITAAITDLLDGALARWRNEQTKLGAYLDPIADKLLLLASFITLACVQSPLFPIPFWFVMFVIVRELCIVGGIICMYARHQYIEIRPTLLGKMTTVVQVAFIVWLFACYFFNWMPVRTYSVALMLVVALVIASCVQYMTVGYRWLQGDKS